MASLLMWCWFRLKLASVLFNLESLVKVMSVPEMLSNIPGSEAMSEEVVSACEELDFEPWLADV